jgi:hypothetical protein
MKSSKFSLCFLLLMMIFNFLSLPLSAQDRTGEMVRVTAQDGNVFIGVVISENDKQITLRVEGVGEVMIEKSNIRSIQILGEGEVKDGEYWYPNPHGTRYFFAPNAIGLKKGSGYYQNTWVFFNNANYGFTDNFSMGAGMVPVFLLGEAVLPFWVLPKFSFPVSPDKFHVGVGALIGGVMGEDTDGSFGLLYGNTTLGDRDGNITLGMGYGFGGGEVSDTPLINISGLYRSGRSMQWLAELYILPGFEDGGIGIFGGRWAPENFALDFGLVVPLTGSEFVGIPWLGVTIPFGNR